MKKVYLGDSVYCEIDSHGSYWLTTENGYPDDPRNKICLEPEVYQALIEFVAARMTAIADQMDDRGQAWVAATLRNTPALEALCRVVGECSDLDGWRAAKRAAKRKAKP